METTVTKGMFYPTLAKETSQNPKVLENEYAQDNANHPDDRASVRKVVEAHSGIWL
jgi:hypothetical protein